MFLIWDEQALTRSHVSEPALDDERARLHLPLIASGVNSWATPASPSPTPPLSLIAAPDLVYIH